MKNKILSKFALYTIIAHAFLVFSSWIVTSLAPDLPIRSLLSNEGVRWFLGHSISNILTPFLAWLLLFLSSYGAIKYSGLSFAIISYSTLDYKSKFALRVTIGILLVLLVVLINLTFYPYAILLSVTGEIYPSVFSKSFMFIIFLLSSILSITYGYLSGGIKTINESFKCLSVGGEKGFPLIVCYIIAVEFYSSLKYVIAIWLI